MHFLIVLVLALVALGTHAAPPPGEEKLSPATQTALAQLEPQRPGIIDLYALIIAGDGEEEVFKREADTVRQVLDERLGTKGRSLSLVNHRSLPQPEATLDSIALVLGELGKRMDPAEDILFLHFTSHGGADHVLVLQHPAHKLDGASPQYLRQVLDRSAIRYRVLVLSGCYTGGFIPALATRETMILTAANAVRPSFGCGNESEITDYSRALYLQALQRTRSLREAAGLAVQLVHENERASKMERSYPQIRSGAAIEERLRRFERQFGGH